MITKDKKKETVSALVENLKDVQGIYFVNFKGMTVADAIRIRRSFKKVDIKYQVAKNSLIKRALDEVGGFDIPDSIFVEETGVVFSYEDPIAPAKIIKKEFDKEKKPTLKAAVVDGQFFEGSQLKELAALPGKPEIMSAIVGSIHAPISGIVGSINAVMRDLAYLVEEVAKKQAS